MIWQEKPFKRYWPPLWTVQSVLQNNINVKTYRYYDIHEYHVSLWCYLNRKSMAYAGIILGHALYQLVHKKLPNMSDRRVENLKGAILYFKCAKRVCNIYNDTKQTVPIYYSATGNQHGMYVDSPFLSYHIYFIWLLSLVMKSCIGQIKYDWKFHIRWKHAGQNRKPWAVSLGDNQILKIMLKVQLSKEKDESSGATPHKMQEPEHGWQWQ